MKWSNDVPTPVPSSKPEHAANLAEEAYQKSWDTPAEPIGPVTTLAERITPSRADVTEDQVAEFKRKVMMPEVMYPRVDAEIWQRHVLKDTNPKDAAGSARIDFSLMDPNAMAELCLAMEEGGTKYGYYNYTVVGVKSRTYVAAAMRHLFKWLMGEERDPKTGVHHLGSTMACAMILLSAMARDKLVDDRPPSNRSASTQLDEFEARVMKVREVFKHYSPKHYTIEDTQNGTRDQIYSPGAQVPAQGSLPREDAQPVQGRHA